MRDAREYVTSGDLVAVHYSRVSKLVAAIAKQWTDKTFQYFSISNYLTRKYKRKNGKTPGNLKDYIESHRFHPNTWTEYIRSFPERRVVPIKEDYLNQYEKVYYDLLKDELNQ